MPPRAPSHVRALPGSHLRVVDQSVIDLRDPSGALVGRRCTLCGAGTEAPHRPLRHAPACPAKRHKRSHGEGDAPRYRAREDRWISALTLPDGRRRVFYGRTSDEARRKRDRARAQVERGLPLPDERLTVGAWLRQWFDQIHAREIKPSTIRAQRTILQRHLLPAFEQVLLVRLTATDVDRYLRRKLAEGLTPAVVATHRGMLHKALQSAALQDRVGRNVVDYTLAPKKTRARSRVAFSADQAVAFLRVIRGHPLEGVFLFGMALGLRMGEATGVLWSDLDIPRRLFYLRHQVAPDVQAEGGACLCGIRCGRAAVLEDLKSRSSTRGLELPEVLVPALRRQAQRIEHQRALRAE
jgi:integrase